MDGCTSYLPAQKYRRPSISARNRLQKKPFSKAARGRPALRNKGIIESNKSVYMELPVKNPGGPRRYRRQRQKKGRYKSALTELIMQPERNFGKNAGA